MDVMDEEMPERPVAGRLLGTMVGTLIGGSIAGPLGALTLAEMLSRKWGNPRSSRG